MSGKRNKRDGKGERQRAPKATPRPNAGPDAARRGPRPARAPESRAPESRASESRAPESRAPERRAHDGRLWLYGQHAVEAALLNPRRYCHELRLRADVMAGLRPELTAALAKRGIHPGVVENDALAALLPPGAVHQGLALRVEPLDQPALEDLGSFAADGPATIILLDQVTDPQNVGAIFRSAAAFGAAALVTQDRHSPPESGALAKAASGALEVLPWVKTVNLSRALDQLAQAGFWRIGLDGQAEQALPAVDLGQRIVLVLGAEGAGLRPGTRGHCDVLARLPMTGAVESLNVSNAAAVALYEFARRSPA